MQEQVVLNDGDVVVTSAALRVGATMYPLGQIASVRMMTQPPGGSYGWLFYLIGVPILLLGALSFAMGLAGGETVIISSGLVFLLIGGVITAIGYKSKPGEAYHFVSISNSSGAYINIVGTADGERANRITQALQYALARR